MSSKPKRHEGSPVPVLKRVFEVRIDGYYDRPIYVVAKGCNGALRQVENMGYHNTILRISDLRVGTVDGKVCFNPHGTAPMLVQEPSEEMVTVPIPTSVGGV